MCNSTGRPLATRIGARECLGVAEAGGAYAIGLTHIRLVEINKHRRQTGRASGSPVLTSRDSSLRRHNTCFRERIIDGDWESVSVGTSCGQAINQSSVELYKENSCVKINSSTRRRTESVFILSSVRVSIQNTR